jgi:hypothetical protein
MPRPQERNGPEHTTQRKLAIILERRTKIESRRAARRNATGTRPTPAISLRPELLECGGSAAAFPQPPTPPALPRAKRHRPAAPPDPQCAKRQHRAHRTTTTRRHSEERLSRRRISSMLQRRDHDDEAAHDVMAGAKQYWMRFFAPLRMTARWTPRPTIPG